MGRRLVVAGLMSALTTLVAAMALRAAEATLAIVAVAAVAGVFAWYAQLHSTDDESGLGLSNPAAAVTLAVVGRRPWSTLLPEIAAHVVGAVTGGLAAMSLEDQLGDTLVFASPSLVLAALGAAVVGLFGAWTTLAIDAGAPEASAAVPVLVGGAALPLGLLTAFQPAAAVGLATAGILPWDVALVAAGAALVGAAVGAYCVSLLVPKS
jgi:glycerol uptake facilitator-like aquaporin